MSVSKVNDIRTRFETAKAAYVRDLAALLNPNGLQIYAPDEDRRQRDEIQQTYRTAMRDIEAALQAVKDAANTDLAAASVTEPLIRLSATELERAGQWRPFIEGDFAALSSEMLVERVREALESGDKARIALHLRYGRHALSSRFADPGKGTRLQQVLAELEDVFVDHTKRDKAQETLDAALQLTSTITKDRYLEQTYLHQYR